MIRRRRGWLEQLKAGGEKGKPVGMIIMKDQLVEFAQDFEVECIKPRAVLDRLPGAVVFAVDAEARKDIFIGCATGAHINKHAVEADGGNFLIEEKFEHKLVIGGVAHGLVV